MRTNGVKRSAPQLWMFSEQTRIVSVQFWPKRDSRILVNGQIFAVPQQTTQGFKITAD